MRGPFVTTALGFAGLVPALAAAQAPGHSGIPASGQHAGTSLGPLQSVEPVGAVPVPPPLPADSSAQVLLSRIDREASELVNLFFGADILVPALIILVLWLFTIAVRKGVQLRAKTVTYRTVVVAAVDTIALVIGASVVIRTLYHRAPLLVAVILTFAGAAVILALGVRMRAWVAGITHVLVGRLRPGHHLEILGREGLVQNIGLFRITLRTDDGDLAYVPVISLDSNTFSVSSPERAYPVELTIHATAPIDAELRRRLRVTALLCPYRDITSEVVVETNDNDERTAAVRFRAWSAPAAARAEAYLRTSVAPVLPSTEPVDSD